MRLMTEKMAKRPDYQTLTTVVDDCPRLSVISHLGGSSVFDLPGDCLRSVLPPGALARALLTVLWRNGNPRLACRES